MAAQLELTFTGAGVVDETFDYTGGGDTMTWKNTRQRGNQVTVNDTIAGQVLQFYNAFLLDYNLTNIYTVTYDATTVTIEHPTNTHFDSFVDATHNNTSFITTAKSTSAQETSTVVTSTYAAHTSNFCTNVAVTFDFNQTVNELTVVQGSGATLTTVYNNASFDNTTIDLVLERNKPRVEVTTKLDGFTAESHVEFCPKPLIIEELVIDENAVGGAVRIEVDENMTGYADNTYAVITAATDETPDYQSSNQFYQLVPGDYYAIVKDNFGCEVQEAFTISDDAVNNYSVPLNIAISQKVSVPFLDRDLISSALTANQYQFMPSERPDRGHTAQQWEAVYAEGQSVQFQWLSSYPDHNFVIVPCSGFPEDTLGVTLSETLYSDNIQRDTYLEGQVFYNATYERLAVSFTPGDQYDSAGNVIGAHTYDDELPNFYEVGTILIVGGEAMTITDIIIDSNKEYAITDSFTNNPSSSSIIHSIHEAQNYEVWGVGVDMSSYTDTTFYIKLEALLNSGSVSRTFQSYKIKVISDAAFTAGKWHVCKFYSAKADEEMVYSSSYPVQYTYRTTRNVEYLDYLTPVSNSEIESKKLDNEVVKIDYDSMEVYETNFAWMPLEYAKTLAKCFNDTDIVEIDNVLYTSISPAELERKGHWGKVKVQVAANENTRNRFSFTTPSTPGYYPVVL